MVLKENQTVECRSKSGIVRAKRRSKDALSESGDLNRGTEERKNIEEIMISLEHLREISARLINAHEEERRRMAHEVHENLAQAFLAVQFRVETALSEMRGNRNTKPLEILEPVTSIVQEGIDSIRRIAGRLRPLILDDLGILMTISGLCKGVVRDHPGLSIDKKLEVEEREIPGPLKVVIYRILESALCSIVKQNPSGTIEIHLGRNGPLISLTIRVHGGPPGSEQLLSGGDILGWSDSATIGERAMLSGGTLTVTSNEGGGTALQVSWPLGEQAKRTDQCPMSNHQCPTSKEEE